MKCEVCNVNELNNYCTTNVCRECCESMKCPMRYKCEVYIKMLEKKKSKPILKIEFNADDIPDCCESCGREYGDILIDKVYNKEIEQEKKYQENYKKGLDKDFEKKLFNTFDKEGRQWLNLYIQKESSEYTIAVLKSLREKIRIKNIIENDKDKYIVDEHCFIW